MRTYIYIERERGGEGDSTMIGSLHLQARGGKGGIVTN